MISILIAFAAGICLILIALVFGATIAAIENLILAHKQKLTSSEKSDKN